MSEVADVVLEGSEPRPLWPEMFAGVEWLALKVSPVYYGFGVPRGDGAPVVLVPGFLGSDRSLLEMHFWLGRLGYRSYLSGVRRNAGCPDVLLERVLETVDRAYRETGRKVRVVGHSLGGLLARAAAVRRPERVAQVVTLASPFRRFAAHPLVISLIWLVRSGALARHLSSDEAGSCECGFVESLQKPLPASVASAAIYTRSDPVVDWRDCLESDPSLNFEVSGTHIGLPVNPMVYRTLAELLSPAVPVLRPEAETTPASALGRAA